MSIPTRLEAYFKDRQLILVVVGAILIASLMTVISLRLYVLDDVSRLDVSLPNRESIRPAISADETKKFDSSGALDTRAISDFQALFSKDRADLTKLGSFAEDPLNPDVFQSVDLANE